jgi:hypothetical protein
MTEGANELKWRSRVKIDVKWAQTLWVFIGEKGMKFELFCKFFGAQKIKNSKFLIQTASWCDIDCASCTNQNMHATTDRPS